MSISVEVELPTGKTVKLTKIKHSDTVRKLKYQLYQASELSLAPFRHDLVFSGRVLVDNELLEKYGIADGSKLSVVPRMITGSNRVLNEECKCTCKNKVDADAELRELIQEYIEAIERKPVVPLRASRTSSDLRNSPRSPSSRSAPQINHYSADDESSEVSDSETSDSDESPERRKSKVLADRRKEVDEMRTWSKFENLKKQISQKERRRSSSLTPKSKPPKSKPQASKTPRSRSKTPKSKSKTPKSKSKTPKSKLKSTERRRSISRRRSSIDAELPVAKIHSETKRYSADIHCKACGKCILQSTAFVCRKCTSFYCSSHGAGHPCLVHIPNAELSASINVRSRGVSTSSRNKHSRTKSPSSSD